MELWRKPGGVGLMVELRKRKGNGQRRWNGLGGVERG